MAEGNTPICEIIGRTKGKTRQPQQIKTIDNIAAWLCFVFGVQVFDVFLGDVICCFLYHVLQIFDAINSI